MNKKDFLVTSGAMRSRKGNPETEIQNSIRDLLCVWMVGLLYGTSKAWARTKV